MITAEITLRRADGSPIMAYKFNATEHFVWDSAANGSIVDEKGNLALCSFAYNPSVRLLTQKYGQDPEGGAL